MRTVAALVVLVNQALTVVENHLAFLHGLLRWQAAVLLAEAHRTAREHGAHAQFAHGVDLHVDGVFQTLREQIVVVGGGGATGEQQFSQRDLGGEGEFFSQPRPHRYRVFSHGNSG